MFKIKYFIPTLSITAGLIGSYLPVTLLAAQNNKSMCSVQLENSTKITLSGFYTDDGLIVVPDTIKSPKKRTPSELVFFPSIHIVKGNSRKDVHLLAPYGTWAENRGYQKLSHLEEGSNRTSFFVYEKSEYLLIPVEGARTENNNLSGLQLVDVKSGLSVGLISWFSNEDVFTASVSGHELIVNGFNSSNSDTHTGVFDAYSVSVNLKRDLIRGNLKSGPDLDTSSRNNAGYYVGTQTDFKTFGVDTAKERIVPKKAQFLSAQFVENYLVVAYLINGTVKTRTVLFKDGKIGVIKNGTTLFKLASDLNEEKVGLQTLANGQFAIYTKNFVKIARVNKNGIVTVEQTIDLSHMGLIYVDSSVRGSHYDQKTKTLSIAVTTRLTDRPKHAHTSQNKYPVPDQKLTIVLK